MFKTIRNYIEEIPKLGRDLCYLKKELEAFKKETKENFDKVNNRIESTENSIKEIQTELKNILKSIEIKANLNAENLITNENINIWKEKLGINASNNNEDNSGSEVWN